MKKRNKHYWKEKQLIRLKLEDAKNHEAIYNQGLIELDEPIPHGYNAEWVLRSDISRRDDAHVYQEALDACKGMIWSKTKDFKYKNWKTKKWFVKKPDLKKINKAKYDALSVSAQKFFYEDTSSKRNYFHKDTYYGCNLSFELVVKITKSYITHRREHDGLLYQKEAEIKEAMYRVSNGHPWGGYGDNKWYRRHESKKIKLAEERRIVEVEKAYKNIGDWKDKNELLDII